MNEREQELKALKKAYKQAKRKTVTLWKTLGIFLLVFSIILSLGAVVVKVFDNAVAAFMGGSFWTLINEDPNAVYFAMDYDTNEEMYEAGDLLCYQVEAEGAALLMNNGALPLGEGAKVSTLSTSSVNLVYGGTGSGNVDASKADNLKVALEKSGLVVNPTLWDFYATGAGSKYSRDAGTGESAALLGSFNIGEAPWSVYTEDVLNSFAEYGDAVIVTISRIGGEGADAELDYLQLDQNEKDMMAAAAQMKADGKVKSIIVLLNTSNALQVDFLKENEYSVDACLWIGGVGAKGTNAVTDILAGKVNPSGSLVDTYLFDNFSSPAMRNAIPVTYAGDTSKIPDAADTYLIYQEGIYVGYKYYETRYEDFVMGTGNAGDYAYADDVAYPFGHGLSYTSFAYSDMAAAYNAQTDCFDVTVTVTNTGSVAGKETVQVYSQAPYTEYDKDNGVEKASANLVGFGKTGVLEPGASETVTVCVEKRDLASYDTYGAKTYILDAGDYYLTVATDSHDATNNFLAAKGYTPETTDGRMDAAGNQDLTFKWTQDKFDAETYATSLNGTVITNQLSLADPNLYEGTQGQEVVWLTRDNWVDTFPAEEQIKLQLTDILIRDLQNKRYDPADYEAVQMPTLGAKNGLKLYDLIGKSYDDPMWEQLLDQLTFDEMVALIGDSFHWRMPAESVQAPGSRDENGPQGLTVALFGSSLGIDATAFTSEDVMAATFNTELMYEVGRLIGNNCLAADVSCLYGPGANMHRIPYGGRNFEYYSEDGFLSGQICAAEVKGLQDKGIDVVIKHFALNDSEQDRIGLGVWVNEQAAREIYLKAYQAAFEKSGANGVMTAYTRWGAVWSGGVKGLMTNILRQEWGNNGMSITDNVITTMVTGADGVLAGTTTYDAMLWFINTELPNYENDAVIVSAMREACHHNLYALANSAAMNGIGPNTTVDAHELPLVITLRVVAIVLWVLCIGAIVMWVLGKRKWKKTEGYRNYMTMRNTIKAEKKAQKLGTAAVEPESVQQSVNGMQALDLNEEPAGEESQEVPEELAEEATEEAAEETVEEATEEKPE